MDRKLYRHEATSVAGFVAQIIRYISSGHYFYVRVLIPEHKHPRTVDQKLLKLYDVARPAWRRERRNLKQSAGIHYLRHDRLAVLIERPGSTTIMHSRLGDLHRSDTGEDVPLGQMSVANHLAMALVVGQVLVRFDPDVNLDIDGLAQKTLGAVAKHLGQDVRRS